MATSNIPAPHEGYAPLFKTKTKTYTLPANASNVSISPDAMEGYTFLCWLSPSSEGGTFGTYIYAPTTRNTSVWVTSTANTARSINVHALYVRDALM